jgi:hypothetical protein
MHTSRELSSAAFAVRIDGRPADLDQVFQEFTEHDRVGVVVRRPCGALGASTLILAAVTAFYDVQRTRGEDFFIYPDYFLFHAGARWGDHRKLDIWPSHKELVVGDDSEELLRAINDRGITRLIVEDIVPRSSGLERASVASARNRIATTLAYAPSGRVADADVQVTGNEVTESYVEATLAESRFLSARERSALASSRRALHEDHRPVESYRRLTLDDALMRL